MSTYKIIKSAVITVMAFTIMACGSANRAVSPEVKYKSPEILMDALSKQQISTKWLDARLRVSFANDEGSTSFITYLRMSSDSAIWMSIKKFSIEAARVLIRPDSVYIIDRLNRQYAIEPIEYMQQQYNIPLGFAGMQALLIGNPVFFSTSSEATADSLNYVLQQRTARFDAQYILDGVSFLIKQWNVLDFRTQSSLMATFSDYKPLRGKKKFSYFRSFNLTHPELGRSKVDITFTKLETGHPVNFSFTIPERYERIH